MNAHKLPSGNYRVQFYKDGKRHSVTRPTAYEAEREAMLLMNGNIPDLTLHEAIDCYINERKNVLSPSTIVGYRVIQRNRFQSVMHLPIADKIRWQQVVNDEALTISPKTLYNSWGLVKAILTTYGVAVPRVQLPQKIREEHEFFQPEQIKKFVKIIEGHENEAQFLLCLHGLRKSEMLAVTDSDVKDGYIYVRGSIIRTEANTYVSRQSNKTELSRRKVPIFIPRLEKLSLEQNCRPDTIGRRFQRLCEENDLPQIGLHGLRHSFISLCWFLDIPLLITMKYSGHTTPNTVQGIYTHLAESRMKESEDKLKRFFV